MGSGAAAQGYAVDNYEIVAVHVVGFAGSFGDLDPIDGGKSGEQRLVAGADMEDASDVRLIGDGEKDAVVEGGGIVRDVGDDDAGARRLEGEGEGGAFLVGVDGFDDLLGERDRLAAIGGQIIERERGFAQIAGKPHMALGCPKAGFAVSLKGSAEAGIAAVAADDDGFVRRVALAGC